jgi:hypothetical protein
MLPGIVDSVVTYNGVPIVDQGSLKTRVNAKYVLDDAQRTLKWVEYTIYIQGVVTLAGLADDGSGTTDECLANLRTKLAEPGNALIFQGKGYGELVVNFGENQQDVNWGPHPQVLQWVPIGDDLTAAVEFQVVCHVATCSEHVAVDTKAIMALGWGVAYSNDADGYTQVTVTGYIEIPLTRQLGSKAAPDTVDAYRDNCFPASVLGFRRDKFDWRVNANRRRADFTVVDTMLAAPLPPNCTIADFEQTLYAETAFPVAVMTLTGTVRIAAQQNPGLALAAFQATVAQLLIAGGMRFNPQMQVIPVPLGAAARALILPLSFQMGNQPFGKDSRFTFKYQIHQGSGVTGKTRLAFLVQASGLWTVMKDFTHQKWQASMIASRVFNSRSTTGLQLAPSEDILIDLCAATPAGYGAVKVGAPQPAGYTAPVPPQPGGYTPVNVSGVSASIDADNSWTSYLGPFVELIQDSGIVAHKPLAGRVTDVLPIAIQVTNPAKAAADTSQPGSDVTVTVPDILQQVETPTAYLRIFGRATRLVYDIDVPQLLKVGSITPVEVGRRVATGTVRSYGDVPETFCNWDIMYRLPLPPANVPTIANPYLNTPGDVS